MITTVMFDLDGTLLPLQQEEFVKVYFGELCKKLTPLGYDSKQTVDAVWAGTRAMMKNDGSRPNTEVFWEMFRSMCAGLPDAKELCDEFYTTEFNKAKCVLKYEADRRPLIEKLKVAGLRLVLATNPLFPPDGMYTRMGWVGLTPDDFELVTDYDNSTFCKPNPEYFREICEKIGADPAECVMIGNNAVEDTAAAKLGIDVFIVPEFLENPTGADYSAYPQGTLEDAVEYVLNKLNT